MESDEDDEVKSHFSTKEGRYELVKKQGLSRPDGTKYITPITLPVRLSFVTLKDGSACESRIAFNVEREILVYRFGGASSQPPHETPNPLNRRVWKGVAPLCHDFNLLTRSPQALDLLVGLTMGHVQIFDPIRRDILMQYNEARQIDKTHVSAVRWVPGSDNTFVAGHMSGCLYVYQRDLPCSSHPHYSSVRQGQTYGIYANKSKGKNPVQRWCVGCVGSAGQKDGDSMRSSSSSSAPATTSPPTHNNAYAINDMAFSPDCKHLAVASQDGYMRVFDFERQRLVCSMRSYFGGMTCVAWSPDGRYVVTGSQDDLVAVFSFHQRRLVARGQSHGSFISCVAFDPYNTSPTCLSPPGTATATAAAATTSCGSVSSDNGSADRPSSASTQRDESGQDGAAPAGASTNGAGDDSPSVNNVFYRFGSVAQDGCLTLWDLGGDILCPAGQVNCGNQSGASLSSLGNAAPCSQADTSAAESTSATQDAGHPATRGAAQANGDVRSGADDVGQSTLSSLNGRPGQQSSIGGSMTTVSSAATSSVTSQSSQSVWKRASHIVRKGHKSRGRSSSGLKGGAGGLDDQVETPPVYSMHDVPLMPALVSKRVASERLCSVAFCHDCVIVAAQDGFLKCFARPTTPGRANGSRTPSRNQSNTPEPEQDAEAQEEPGPAPQIPKPLSSSAV